MSTKFSQFPNGNNPRTTDILVGLRAGANEKFTFTGLNDSNGDPIVLWSTGLLKVIGPGTLGFPVNTAAELPSVGYAGASAYVSDTDTLVYWSVVDEAWVEVGTGGGDTVEGTPNQINVSNVGDIATLSLSSTMILPGTLQLGNLLFSGNTLASINVDGNINYVPNGAGLNIFTNAQIGNVTPNRAVVTDASSNLTASLTTATEIGFVHGVTSSIQAQINALSAGTVTAVNGTANQVTASTLSGVVTLSLPASVIMPGTLTLNANPTTALQAATKQYVDALAGGFTFQPACFVATVANLTSVYNNGASGVGATLTNSGSQAAFTADGVSVAINARVLVRQQTNTYENGIYTLTTVGSGATDWVLTRATDYDTSGDIQPGDFILVTNGSTLINTAWIETDTVTTMGTDPIVFNQFNPGAGAVMNVTASAPLASSGGQTPNISLTANVPLNLGGTNAALTASNGGLVYSTASALAILAGTATPGQVPLSGASSAPGWSTATYLSTLTANGILYASATNTMAQITTVNNSIMATNGSGVPALTTTMPSAVQLSPANWNSGTGASASTFAAGDGTWKPTSAIAGAGRLLNMQVFTSGATVYTPTSGAASVLVKAWGAGAGGGSSNNGIGGGAGGAGAYVEALFAISGLTPAIITIGIGGIGALANNGSVATNGAPTSFGTTLVAAGGTAPANGNNPGGAGGTIGACTVPSGGFAMPGGQGGYSNTVTLIASGGAAYGNIAQVFYSGAGKVGLDNSGQGGGAGLSVANAGNGGSGLMIIYEYS